MQERKRSITRFVVCAGFALLAVPHTWRDASASFFPPHSIMIRPTAENGTATVYIAGAENNLQTACCNGHPDKPALIEKMTKGLTGETRDEIFMNLVYAGTGD